ncbi:hypothetical protein V3C99_018401 [Haemonchus contortus]|uniref:DDE_Tnp_1_7 domain-containing protein n=1 Tax=Haemonchus contortus TaxID=6289 RepID=A0A7I4Z4X4_HAECO
MKHILFTKLAQLPACDPEGRQLSTLYNRMFSLVRQFCNGGDDSKETALGALLLKKLPVRVRSQIYDRTSNSHNVTPSELLHVLQRLFGKVREESTMPRYYPTQLHQSFCLVDATSPTSLYSTFTKKTTTVALITLLLSYDKAYGYRREEPQ